MIRTLLVANRGEIAVRIMRTARGMGIDTVAVFSDADADAPFVTAADAAVRLPGTAVSETYLRGDLLIAAALSLGADAVHPGYGFLSESAGFARACADAGLRFVGPSPAVIEAMGSKLRAKEVMRQAGVPVLRGVEVTGQSDDRALRDAGDDLGYPLLVKAAFGGGGRGMRLVGEAAELQEAVAAARREATSAFGDGTVFLERFVVDPRHIEVQILGDVHGTVVHLFERECSIQRRYQKIIEECPSAAVDEPLRARLGAAAVAAGRAIGYVGAGTVEFVLSADGDFGFLEVNTRLQVEHPVTELVTGLDLVALQLRIAEGAVLPAAATSPRRVGHAVEARLYAEVVAAGFLPATGTLQRFLVQDLPGVRVDAGVQDGSVIGTAYDPLLAKVIAHAETRGEACRLLARALATAQIHGVTTNRDLLVGILSEPDFLAGHIDTAYLNRHDPVALAAPDPEAMTLHAVAAALAQQARNRAAARVVAAMPSGWRNVPSGWQRAAYRQGVLTREVRYRFGRRDLAVEVDDVPIEGIVLHAATKDRVDLEAAGARRTFAVHLVGTSAYVDSALGSSALEVVPRFGQPRAGPSAGSLLAPMPGAVLRVLVQPGAAVAAGAPLVVLEAMKMEHVVAAPAAGVVAAVHVAPGDQVDAGQPLAALDLAEAVR